LREPPLGAISLAFREAFMQQWDAKTYDRFEAERARPSRDLIARIPIAPKRIVDLGCGSGLSTLALREAFPKARIVGVDLSPDMLAAAAKRLPKLTFQEGDAATFDASGFDLVFANAVFQWVPDHLSVLRRLAASLPEGGCLAVQMPDNEEEPSHRLMREIAAFPAFDGKSGGGPRAPIHSFGQYDAALSPPCEWVDIWRTTYVQRMNSPEDIVKWVEGAGLRPYLDPLDEAGRASYLAAYREAVAEAYAAQPNGAIQFPFPRLFIVAARSGLTKR
jgi:trans-aconitate 2-methyltransferase